jgi:hypothetical protein
MVRRGRGGNQIGSCILGNIVTHTISEIFKNPLIKNKKEGNMQLFRHLCTIFLDIEAGNGYNTVIQLMTSLLTNKLTY